MHDVATMCPLLELNGHSYTGYVKLTSPNHGSVWEHGGCPNSCPDDMNFMKEKEEHADVTSVDAQRSGVDREDWSHPVLDHPEQTHEVVAMSTWKGKVHARDSLVDETCEICGMSMELGMNSFHCDCGAEENSESPENTKNGAHVDGERASCVKTDTVLLNTNTWDFASHCAVYTIYYCIGDYRRTHLTHDPVYLSEDVPEGAMYLTRMSEPEDYCLSHDRAACEAGPEYLLKQTEPVKSHSMNAAIGKCHTKQSAENGTADGRDDLRSAMTVVPRCCGPIFLLTQPPADSRGTLKSNVLAEHLTSEHRTCEDPKEKVFCATVTSDLAKSATDNHLEGQMEESLVVNNLENFVTGMCTSLPLCESRTEWEDPTAELLKKHCCSHLGNEACSTYVHPAIRMGHEMDGDGCAMAAYRMHDLDSCGGESLDGCKACGMTYRADALIVTMVEMCSHENTTDEEKGAHNEDGSSNSNLNLCIAREIRHTEMLSWDVVALDCPQPA